MTRLIQWRISLSYKLIIEGLEKPILIPKGQTTSLSVSNKTLFSRIVSSLLEGSGDSLEKFAFYKDGEEAKFSKEALNIVDPFNLPFKNVTLLKNLFQKIDNVVRFNDELLIKVNELQLLLNQELGGTNSYFHCDYDFGVEFDVKKYLKAFGYASDIDGTSSLLDSLISFLNFIADVAPDKVLLIVNLASFLEKKDYICFIDKVFSLKLTAFIVNSGDDVLKTDNFKNYVIDQHFILK